MPPASGGGRGGRGARAEAHHDAGEFGAVGQDHCVPGKIEPRPAEPIRRRLDRGAAAEPGRPQAAVAAGRLEAVDQLLLDRRELGQQRRGPAMAGEKRIEFRTLGSAKRGRRPGERRRRTAPAKPLAAGSFGLGGQRSFGCGRLAVLLALPLDRAWGMDRRRRRAAVEFGCEAAIARPELPIGVGDQRFEQAQAGDRRRLGGGGFGQASFLKSDRRTRWRKAGWRNCQTIRSAGQESRAAIEFTIGSRATGREAGFLCFGIGCL